MSVQSAENNIHVWAWYWRKHIGAECSVFSHYTQHSHTGCFPCYLWQIWFTFSCSCFVFIAKNVVKKTLSLSFLLFLFFVVKNTFTKELPYLLWLCCPTTASMVTSRCGSVSMTPCCLGDRLRCCYVIAASTKWRHKHVNAKNVVIWCTFVQTSEAKFFQRPFCWKCISVYLCISVPELFFVPYPRWKILPIQNG